MGRHRSAAALSILIPLLAVRSAIAAGVPAPSPLDALPDTVYALNNFPTDEVDQTIVGLVWTRLGLMDANGKVAKKNAANNDLELNGVKVGEVIVQGGDVIGWKNLNGKREAYDLSGGATFAANVWPRVKAGGFIEILKHGLSAAEGSGWTNGGALQLDKKANAPAGSKGERYNGFTVQPAEGQQPGAGTGRLEDATAYVLPSRQGDDIKVVLTVCYSNLQPRKNQDPAKPSVKETIAAIPGVVSAKGYTQCAEVKASIGLSGIFPPLAYAVMYVDMAKKGDVEKGVDDLAKQIEKVNDWMKKLPTFDAYDKTKARLVAASVDSLASPVFRYSEPTDPPTGEIAGDEYTFAPSTPAVADADGGAYSYEDSLTRGARPRIIVPPDALSGETELAIHIWPGTGVPIPSGEVNAASRATEFVFEGLAGPTVVGDLTLVLPFNLGYSDVRLYRLVGSVWSEVTSAVADYDSKRFTLQTQTMGVYQVFSAQEPVPPPPPTSLPMVPPLGLIALALAAALSGARVLAGRVPGRLAPPS